MTEGVSRNADGAPLLDHVALAIPDVGRYIGLLENLGMKLERTGTHHATGGKIAFVADPAGRKLELIESEVDSPKLVHLAFEVSDAEAAYGRLLSGGYVPVAAPLRLEAAGADTAFVSGADGLEVQIISYE